jgi:hypothetical protein
MGNMGDPTILHAMRSLGPGLLAEICWAVITDKRRSLAADAARVAPLLRPPPLIEGRDNIPPRQAFVLVANHYLTPGVWIGQVCLAISLAVAEARVAGGRDLHWLALAEWRWFEFRGRWVPNPLTALVFSRALRVWGSVPTPANPADVAGGASALRQVMGYLGRRGKGAAAEPQPVALCPEGTGTIALGPARPGSGAFLQRLSSRGFPLLPVAQWQLPEGRILIRFGRPFYLGDPPAGCPLSLDDWARQKAMGTVGSLMPPELWGVYAEAAATELAAQNNLSTPPAL